MLIWASGRGGEQLRTPTYRLNSDVAAHLFPRLLFPEDSRTVNEARWFTGDSVFPIRFNERFYHIDSQWCSCSFWYVVVC